MILFLICFILLLLLPDLYIWFSFVRGTAPLLWSIVYWIPTTLALSTMSLWLAGSHPDWMIRLFFGLLLCVSVPKLVFAVISLTGRGIGLAVPHAATVGHAAGILAAAVVCVAFFYGFTRGWKRLETKEIEIASADLPAAFDGYRIVQLSDLHVGTFGSDTTYLRQLVEQVNALHPDMIVFTGDLVNDSAEELDPYLEILPRLSAPDGVFSILGNHDYCTYRRYDTADGAARNLAEVKRRQRNFGWDLLLNESRIVRRGGDSIALIGVENDGRPPFPSRGDLPRAMREVPENAFKILLSHDPTHWRREVLPPDRHPAHARRPHARHAADDRRFFARRLELSGMGRNLPRKRADPVRFDRRRRNSTVPIRRLARNRRHHPAARIAAKTVI